MGNTSVESLGAPNCMTEKKIMCVGPDCVRDVEYGPVLNRPKPEPESNPNETLI